MFILKFIGIPTLEIASSFRQNEHSNRLTVCRLPKNCCSPKTLFSADFAKNRLNQSSFSPKKLNF